jgi:dTDP-4-dehydrorhamnose reductase
VAAVTVLVTGLGGTLAPVLAAALTGAGETVAGWDRSRIPPDDRAGGRGYLDRLDPSAVCHLAMGPETWAADLAAWCRDHDRPFLFTSTAMVFDRLPDGPHRVGDGRSAKDEYGRYKIRCEDAIRAVSGAAVIARIGWQIGTERGGNNMLEALYGAVERHGVIRASRLWIPACSLMTDTADALVGLLGSDAPGVYHLDSNVNAALDYPTIVEALAVRQRAAWRIEATEDYAHDQRLPDPRLLLPDLAERLGLA